VLVAIALFAGADLVARFFEEPRAALVLRVLSVSVLIDGFVSITSTLLRKTLEFRKFFWFQMSVVLTELLVTLVMAVVWRNVWALVAGRVAAAIVRLVSSYAIAPRRPRLVWDRHALRELHAYGKWLTASSIFLLVLGQGDGTYVGKVFGASALAFYQWAYRLSNLPATAISEVIALVMFPAYSVVQDSRREVGTLYIRVIRLTAFLALPVAAIIGVMAPFFVPLLLGDRWLPIVPLVGVLSVYGSLRAIGATSGSLFLALGRPDIRTWIQGGQLVMFLLVLVPFAERWQTLGVAFAITTHAILFNLFAVWRAGRLSEVRASQVVTELAGPLLASLVAIALGVLLRRQLFTEATVTGFLVVLVAVIGIYLGVMALWDRHRNHTIRDEIRRLVAAVRRPAKIDPHLAGAPE
jgi:O-antigen/teichoic acid export membrane protein